MLVRITEKCTMGCNHCMVDATPNGEHMTRQTFVQVLNWICAQGIAILFMSGGEPTEHPDILDFIMLSRVHGIKILLLSNGEFLNANSKEGEKFREEILNNVFGVQVTNDPRFYPRHVPKFNHPKVCWETTIRGVSPLGRAVTNKLEASSKAPGCFNLRSLTRTLGSYNKARLNLVARGKMCTPSINVDGSISAGESPFCTKIGTMNSTEGLTATIQKMQCAQCGLVSNLDQKHKAAIGEG